MRLAGLSGKIPRSVVVLCVLVAGWFGVTYHANPLPAGVPLRASVAMPGDHRKPLLYRNPADRPMLGTIGRAVATAQDLGPACPTTGAYLPINLTYRSGEVLSLMPDWCPGSGERVVVGSNRGFLLVLRSPCLNRLLAHWRQVFPSTRTRSPGTTAKVPNPGNNS